MRKSLLRIAASSCYAAFLVGCALAPASSYQVASTALPSTEAGALHAHASRIAAGLDDGQSAYWLVDGAELALDARLALIDRAQRSLDIQYFIWEAGISGRLLIDRLIAAADRGVRVRLLLDDLTMSKRDWEYLALQQHPRIEVRSFNPWNGRSRVLRVLQFLTKFDQLNHRMHIKTVVADGHFGVLGGRNVGDRYFGVYDVFVQNDLDVMTVGPMVAELAATFDEYWNSELSYPIEALARPRHRRVALAELESRFEEEYLAGADKLAMYPLEPADWSDFFARLEANYARATGVLVYDAPESNEHSPRVVYDRFLALLEQARERVIISTAYLIPEPGFVDLLEDLVERGVEVAILTNSLETNNHMIAHTGYRRWRRRILDTGVALYELRADASSKSVYSLPPTDAGFLGLHTKAVVVDDRYSFIGSPNVDPRSMLINAEIGVFLESPGLTSKLATLLERDLAPSNSWRVTMDEEGWLYWTNDEEVVMHQPAKGFKHRFMEFFINLFPIKNQA